MKSGYECDVVDDFLDAVADQTEKLVRDNIAMKNSLQEMEEALAAAQAELAAAREAAAQQPEVTEPAFNEASYLKNVETTLRDTLIKAQRVADETIDEAKKKAEKIVAEAEAQANALKEETDAKVAEANANFEALKTASEEYRRNFNELIEGQAKLLNENPMYA